MKSVTNLTKLLKMKAKALEVNPIVSEKDLQEYASLVTEIDNFEYLEFISKVKQITFHNNSLEEEISYLKELDVAYKSLEEKQLLYQETYAKYTDKSLTLSDLSVIDIVAIRARIETIDEYLSNLNSIEICHQKLEHYSNKLADAEQMKIRISEIIKRLENELCFAFLNSKGQLSILGNSEPTSTVNEYQKVDLDIELLLKDSNLINKYIDETSQQIKEEEENLKASEICHRALPTKESGDLLASINKKITRLRYKSTLLSIASIIANKQTELSKSIIKRENLLNLIDYRVNCLKNLSIHFLIDPLSRIKIASQLDKLTAFNDPAQEINDIRTLINQISVTLNGLDNKNKELKALLAKSISYITISNESSEKYLPKNNYSFPRIVVMVKPNQVIAIKDISSDLNLRILKEKTYNVIHRIMKMLRSELPDKATYIEPIPYNDTDKDFIGDSQSDIDLKLEDIHSSLPYFEQEDIIFSDVGIEKEVSNDGTLFEDFATEPFQPIVLFNDKKEEESINNSITDVKMDSHPEFILDTPQIFPDLMNKTVSEIENNEEVDNFWPTKIETVQDDESQNIVSFDEQLRILRENEKQQSEQQKIKKKVA